MSKRTPIPAIERFWPKVQKTDSCWLWTAAKMTDGHGCFTWNGRGSSAHRFAYEELVGPIPDGYVIDHICHVPACVNPDLQAVTPRQNSENRSGAARQSSSGYRGVYRTSSIGWDAVVESGGKRYKEGPFRSPEAANEAAVAMRHRLMTNNLCDPPAAA